MAKSDLEKAQDALAKEIQARKKAEEALAKETEAREKAEAARLAAEEKAAGLQGDLDSANGTIAEIEQSLAEALGGVDLTDTDEGELSDAAKAMIAEACEAHGIASRYVLSAGFDAATGEAVVVTFGGAKVRYAAGDKVEKLSRVRVTGEAAK